jgi:lipoprotein-anchoring transpeptidase ErfK/SrfK
MGMRLAIVFGGAVLVAVAVIVIAGLGGSDAPGSSAGSGRAALDRELTRRAGPQPRRDQVAIVEHSTALRATPGGRKLASIGTHTEFKSARVLSVLGRRGDWLRVIASELPNGKRGWVAASATSLVPIDYRIRVDLSARRIEVLRSGHVVRRIRAAVGEQGTSTPTGLFAVTDKVPFPARGSAYGCCAVALSAHQPNTPSEWSGGDRIAIHATPMRQSIGRPVTLGCMRVLDADARWLMRWLPLGTRVSIRA